MSSVVAELDKHLQSMLEMKPPGANQQKITSVTTLCNANIQSETVLIQKLYTHFKKAPANYKLGALYVVDSIARSWLDQAKKAGQELGPSAADGTFAAGVHHLTELLPSFMSDITTSAPEEHKAKIKKLIDIWRRGATFPSQMITSFEEKLNASSNNVHSTTPTGTPPQAAVALAANAFPAAPASSVAPAATSNLEETLKALAGMAQSSAPITATAPAPTPTPINMQMPGAFPQPVNGAAPPPPMQYPPVAGHQQPPNMNGMYGNPALASLFAGQQQQAPQQPAYPIPQQQQPSMPPTGMPGMPAVQSQNDMMKQIQILAQLKAANVPQEQWASLLPVLMSMPQQPGAAGMTGMPAMPAGMPAPSNQGTYPTYGGADQSRDVNGYESIRSPSGRDRRRSRSPGGWDRRREGSPGRHRDSPAYDRRGGRDRDRGRGDRDGRRRSPDRFRRSPSPRRDGNQQGGGANIYDIPDPASIPKRVEYDPELKQNDMIRVYSRTLFVGGVTCSEEELRKIFSEFGRVQTCIVNIDKRHAFVKMITRDEAMRARIAMEKPGPEHMQLRTRWGVGFGPRDCSDYGTGVSVIPIGRLTDADRKWMLTAEFGGSGGKPIEGGLVVEEPDIEIGAGVSSKAISRRMQTDRSGQHGPRSSREQVGAGNAGGGVGRRSGRDDDNPNNISVAQPVPGYGGFNFGQEGANGMPIGFNQGFA